MKIKILFFGITTDFVGKNLLEITLQNNINVAELKVLLQQKFNKLANVNTYAIAVNEEYAKDELILQENDVIAIIPPVSGG